MKEKLPKWFEPNSSIVGINIASQGDYFKKFIWNFSIFQKSYNSENLSTCLFTFSALKIRTLRTNVYVIVSFDIIYKLELGCSLAGGRGKETTIWNGFINSHYSRYLGIFCLPLSWFFEKLAVLLKIAWHNDNNQLIVPYEWVEDK